MDKKLTLASGREIEVDSVVRGNQFDMLAINLHTLTYAEVGFIFSDPEETKVLVYTEGENTKTYRMYTEIYSIGKSPFYSDKNEIMIRLERPRIEVEE